jgi:2-phosphosulfolactate phosphatase
MQPAPPRSNRLTPATNIPMTDQEIRTHFLPQLVAPAELAGGASVVIDVLRATTTITAALAAGAREVIPCLEIDDARRAAAKLPAGQAVLGGERGGVKIDGFDLGNSPNEYTPARVAGKSVVFTTTNGTRAMLHAAAADEIWLAALVNIEAVVARCVERPRIDILCAGTGGKITREDVLAAGAIAAALTGAGGGQESKLIALNDQARIAQDAWLRALGSPDDDRPLWKIIEAALRQTQGGRNLNALGLESDLADAAACDRYSIVPRFDPRSGRITPG